MAIAHGIRAFIATLSAKAQLLDCGCGNNSPYKVKSQRPDIYYIGLDVGNYNQTAPILADRYIVVPPEQFTAEIQKLSGSLDAVISSHNIEHCLEPVAVVAAMAAALRKQGRLYISFPSAASAGFPSRRGCLNFHDDPTHRQVPDFDGIEAQLRAAGCDIIVARRRYKPWLLWLLGAVQEPWSRRSNRVLRGTWAYYGFESVIWARKP